jgi:hypothetical protein
MDLYWKFSETTILIVAAMGIGFTLGALRRSFGFARSLAALGSSSRKVRKSFAVLTCFRLLPTLGLVGALDPLFLLLR